MVARHYYRNTAGDLEEQTVPREGWQARQNAEEGSVGSWTIVVPDPDMTLEYTGHRMWAIFEDESESDDDVLAVGYTGTQEISRGEEGENFEPIARVWSIEVFDQNSLWSRRVLTGTDCKRPAETDVARVQWLIASDELTYWTGPGDITTYVATGDPVNMDAVDYRGQMVNAVMDDCAQASGKNWFVQTLHNGVDDGGLCVFYGDYTYDSPLWITNSPGDTVEADLIAGTSLVWPVSGDTKLRRDPSRVFSGGYLQYQGGAVYRQRAATEVEFALGYRDMIVPAGNVKTKTKAIARVVRTLNDVSSQDERITTTVRLPKGKATMVKPGMRVQFRGTHLPGYETFKWCRVLNASPTPVSAGAFYDIALELQGPGDDPDPDFIYEGTITIPGDTPPSANLDPTGASGWENDTVYGYSITGARASGADSGYSWGWRIGFEDNSLSAAAYFDDGAWLFGANGMPNTIDSPGTEPGTTTSWARTGTFTTNDAGHFNAANHLYFMCANANSVHGGSTWTWTWQIWKIG